MQRHSGQWKSFARSELVSDILRGKSLTQIIISEEIKKGLRMQWLIDGKQRCTTLDDFLQLTEGDIIKLDNKVTDDLIVKVNGEKKFFARPGTIKDNICVKITEVYDEMHELLRNYF